MICSIYDVELDDIRSKSRERFLFYVRVVIACVLRSQYNLTFVEIGKYINRDHATITYYKKMYDDLAHYDRTFKDMITSIWDILLDIKTALQAELQEELEGIIN
jgi:chromosomal replication initiation ATPase DnaA